MSVWESRGSGSVMRMGLRMPRARRTEAMMLKAKRARMRKRHEVDDVGRRWVARQTSRSSSHLTLSCYRHPDQKPRWHQKTIPSSPAGQHVKPEHSPRQVMHRRRGMAQAPDEDADEAAAAAEDVVVVVVVDEADSAEIGESGSRPAQMPWLSDRGWFRLYRPLHIASFMVFCYWCRGQGGRSLIVPPTEYRARQARPTWKRAQHIREISSQCRTD